MITTLSPLFSLRLKFFMLYSFEFGYLKYKFFISILSILEILIPLLYLFSFILYNFMILSIKRLSLIIDDMLDNISDTKDFALLMEFIYNITSPTKIDPIVPR